MPVKQYYVMTCITFGRQAMNEPRVKNSLGKGDFFASRFGGQSARISREKIEVPKDP